MMSMFRHACFLYAMPYTTNYNNNDNTKIFAELLWTMQFGYAYDIYTDHRSSEKERMKLNLSKKWCGRQKWA